ncbi:MAG: 2Fe-2S iron-sulfur cluster binding domain-containing protein [Alphaproteobacteria bacterium]|nr:2Fe-2S iron-sulfur cluster binding domain-containing protein [Alphaproteobacteria bacterium]
MTALELFLYILCGIIVQIALFALLAFKRHWQKYDSLKRRSSEIEESEPDVPMPSWEGFRDFRVVRKCFEDSSRSVCSFHLVPVDAKPLASFLPGQFLTFRLNVGDPSGDGKSITRCYSLSDRPGLDHYRISVKRLASPGCPAGLSSNHLHDNIQEGSVLSAKAPSGLFHLRPGSSPVVLIAGGIGITPVLCMLNASLQSGSKREIWLFYGVRSGAEHVMKAHLEELAARHTNFRLRVCYSRPNPSDRTGQDFQHQGHVDLTLLRLNLSPKSYDFYVCGPRAMMETLVPSLHEWGVSSHRIHYEAFGPASLTQSANPTVPEQSSAQAISVTFSKSAKTLVWDNGSASLLDFAEKNGIRVDSGCRAGGCGTCQTPIESGEVEYLHTPDFDVEPGCCLLCSSRPSRDLVLSA